MGDFSQTGAITTLHNLTRRSAEELEQELVAYASSRPVTLILPSLFSELEGDALPAIVDELAQVPYLNRIVIGLDRADRDQFAHARSFFSKLPQDHVILWNDGPRLRAIDAKLAEAGLAPTEPGKGRNVWYCLGYALAAQNADVIAIHDCDIVTYSRDLLARLVYPVANPAFRYVFSKGYYARIANNTINGRVCRLLVTPLLHALNLTVGPHNYIDYLSAFRYPLSGEFAMRVSVVPDMRIPTDWGLEIGVLSEMRRNTSARAICQVDIADIYDHKHQDLSQEDRTKGLSRMSIDITKAIFRKLATEGVIFSAGTLRSVKATYFRAALDLIESYHADALMNGLTLDRHKEEQAVELFAANITAAGEVFLENPSETPFIPNWRRVNAAFPGLLSELADAVARDGADGGLQG
ncbi:glycosyl transferase [Nitratireductor mangrovi]|uniref:Glycosyl transferase n=1 Tax=Nitratireductor mangrovi TaxID=2599600 RepID=A0A5B8KUU1_9HYPH|nr:glycosyl transferase [Nitratireductor mangrovi]QDY99327.1 glycosyl transferase [Nitratireductor mangrovi]